MSILSKLRTPEQPTHIHVVSDYERRYFQAALRSLGAEEADLSQVFVEVWHDREVLLYAELPILFFSIYGSTTYIGMLPLCPGCGARVADRSATARTPDDVRTFLDEQVQPCPACAHKGGLKAFLAGRGVTLKED